MAPVTPVPASARPWARIPDSNPGLCFSCAPRSQRACGPRHAEWRMRKGSLGLGRGGSARVSPRSSPRKPQNRHAATGTPSPWVGLPILRPKPGLGGHRSLILSRASRAGEEGEQAFAASRSHAPTVHGAGKQGEGPWKSSRARRNRSGCENARRGPRVLPTTAGPEPLLSPCRPPTPQKAEWRPHQEPSPTQRAASRGYSRGGQAWPWQKTQQSPGQRTEKPG